MKTGLILNSRPIFALMAVGVFVGACDGGDWGLGTGPTPCPEVSTTASVKLNTNSLTLRVGESRTLSADVRAANGPSACLPWTKWTSSDPKIAWVLFGVVTAEKDGSTWIKASSGLVADSAFVTVSTPTVGVNAAGSR